MLHKSEKSRYAGCGWGLLNTSFECGIPIYEHNMVTMCVMPHTATAHLIYEHTRILFKYIYVFRTEPFMCCFSGFLVTLLPSRYYTKAKCCMYMIYTVYSFTQQIYSSYVRTQANMMQYLCIMYLDFLLLHIHSVQNACFASGTHWNTCECRTDVCRTEHWTVESTYSTGTYYTHDTLCDHIWGLEVENGMWCAIAILYWLLLLYTVQVKSPVGNALDVKVRMTCSTPQHKTHFCILLEHSSGCATIVNLCGRIYVWVLNLVDNDWHWNLKRSMWSLNRAEVTRVGWVMSCGHQC